jgi:hypothetical protein
VDPDRRMQAELEDHEGDHADDADRAHDEEGRAVGRIGEAVVQPAFRAGFTQAQVTLEDRALATARAAGAKAGLQRADRRIGGAYLLPVRVTCSMRR